MTPLADLYVAVGQPSDQPILHLVSTGGLQVVCGLFFIVWGGAMRFFPHKISQYDLSRPENAPFARKQRMGGMCMIIIGICMVVLGLLDVCRVW